MTIALSFSSHKIALDAIAHMRMKEIKFRWCAHSKVSSGMFMVKVDDNQELPPLLEQYVVEQEEKL